MRQQQIVLVGALYECREAAGNTEESPGQITTLTAGRSAGLCSVSGLVSGFEPLTDSYTFVRGGATKLARACREPTAERFDSPTPRGFSGFSPTSFRLRPGT